MFGFLRKKLNRYIIVTIMSIITISFLSLYAVFRYSLENDYIEKQENVHKQIARLLDMRITQIENSIDMYIFKTQLGSNLLDDKSLNATADFKTLKTYSPDVSYAMIYDTEMKLRYYSSSVPLTDFDTVLITDETRKIPSKSGSFWQCGYIRKTFSPDSIVFSWIYTTPIYCRETLAGYISVAIFDQCFIDFFDDFRNDYCVSDSFYLSSEKGKQNCIKQILSKENKLDESNLYSVLNNEHTETNRPAKISAYPLSPDGMRLICVLRNSYPKNLSDILLKWILSAWILLMVLCVFSSFKVTEHFIDDLNNLTLKVKNYTNSKQKEQTHDQDNDC